MEINAHARMNSSGRQRVLRRGGERWVAREKVGRRRDEGGDRWIDRGTAGKRLCRIKHVRNSRNSSFRGRRGGSLLPPPFSDGRVPSNMYLDGSSRAAAASCGGEASREALSKVSVRPTVDPSPLRTADEGCRCPWLCSPLRSVGRRTPFLSFPA